MRIAWNTKISVKQLTYFLILMQALLLPVHFFVSRAVRGEVGMVAFLLLFTVMIVCLFIPRADPFRFVPFLLGFGILVLHAVLFVVS